MSRRQHRDRAGGDPEPDSLIGDGRGLTPAVGKALEVGLVVVFVGVVASGLYGGAVPAYRAAAGDIVADRTVAAAAERIENAVPPPARDARVVRGVDLPTTIRGAAYHVGAENRTLVVDHPAPGVTAWTPLVLPPRVVAVTGTWESGADCVVVVATTDDGVVVRLTDRAAFEEGAR